MRRAPVRASRAARGNRHGHGHGNRHGHGGIDAASVVALAAFALAWLLVALIRGVPAWVGWLHAGASVLAFVLYAVDKSAAIGGRQRLLESMLLGAGYVGGWPGAVIAQQVLRHKTVKRSFRVRFWIGAALNVALFAWATTAMR